MEQRLASLEGKGQEQVVVLEEPIMDYDGKPITDDSGRPVMRRIARPTAR